MSPINTVPMLALRQMTITLLAIYPLLLLVLLYVVPLYPPHWALWLKTLVNVLILVPAMFFVGIPLSRRLVGWVWPVRA